MTDRFQGIAKLAINLLIALDQLSDKHCLDERDVLAVLSVSTVEWAKQYNIGLDDWLEVNRLANDRARKVLK